MTHLRQATPAHIAARGRERHDHRVEFYADDATLVRSVRRFLDPALSGGVAVVVATPAHRQVFTRAVAAGAASGDEPGRLVVLDARQTLDRFMVDGMPDGGRFRDVVGGVLASAASSGGPVRIYGEMVAVLWQDGWLSAAIALEDLWNELAAEHTFGLLCGYPSALFAHPSAGPDFATVCDRHSAVALPHSEPLAGLVPDALAEADEDDESAVRWQFHAGPASGARARQQLRELFATWRLGDLLDETELLTTELINNAVVHANSAVWVSLRQRRHALRVEVTDVGGGMLQLRDGDLDDTHGRGLRLVDAISAEWGATVRGSAKTVWFELRREPEPARQEPVTRVS